MARHVVGLGEQQQLRTVHAPFRESGCVNFLLFKARGVASASLGTSAFT